MRVGDEIKELGPGDFAYVPPNVLHGGESLTDYVLALDIWTPPRKDVAKRLEELQKK
jgi:quercetin dioxygenase-like cupin family protein